MPALANGFVAGHPAAPDVIVGDVDRAGISELEPAQIIVDAGLVVVQVLVPEQRTLYVLSVGLEPVFCGYFVVSVSVPIEIGAHEQGSIKPLWLPVQLKMPVRDAKYVCNV